jgi:outer membrane protein
MSGKRWGRLVFLMGILVVARSVFAFDVLRAEQNVSASAAGSMVGVQCQSGLPGSPLLLAEAVSRALCSNPRTREAWADVKAQAAGVGVARAAYLPTLSGNWQGVRENYMVDVTNHPTLGSDYTSMVQSGSISLNWVLFDFGGREAALRNANALLEAARATQDATLQTMFAAVAKDYYAAQAAVSALVVAGEVERMTNESTMVATARVNRGVVPISDQLQAQTQHGQAVFNLTKAQADTQMALGTLASDMGLNPDEPLTVPPVTDTEPPGRNFSESVAQLIDDVRDTHPAVRAARAQYEAALAKVAQTRAAGLPNISLVAKYSLDNQPQSMGLGMPTYPATGHDAYIGVQVTIPLFEGFSRHYQIDQAKAEAEREQDALDDARRQVALEVWNSYHLLESATQNVGNSTDLLKIAQRAYVAAERRYAAGVGNILELLNTQAALANAQQRHVQAFADWDNARLDLASKLGRLDMDDVSGH